MNRCKYCKEFYKSVTKNRVIVIREGKVWCESDYCSTTCLDSARICDAKQLLGGVKQNE